MINYMKSESYRLLRKKSLHTTSVICLLLIAAAAAILYYSQQQDPDFPYATSMFFYSNVISGALLIMIVGLLFNSALTGKDTSLIKQSVSFGISRNTIFWSKLILTLSYFLLICVIGIILTIALGETLLASGEQSVRNFLIAASNMVPIVLSGFFIIHVLKMLKVSEVYIIILFLFLYIFSGNLLYMLFDYTPSTLLNDNLMSFMNGAAQFDYRHWLTGIVISVISLLAGQNRFAKQNID
ncbi:ABC transporter permease [Virgibacillus sp. YIM 98842]|uniref:ABC transporter permease n=1 Tax=Virgibacillus sp. YIM 98842 TaxID=2663533 RepID=UPI0013DC75E3|nr:ABC transporter permease [Virgibacillus sp. YIM 98842]